MRLMTSREIHSAIQTALGEVSRGLASGELDRSGRYYSDSELGKRFAYLSRRRNRPISRDRKPSHSSAKSA